MKLLMPILSLELLGGEQYLIITTELANQCAQKALFTCEVYTLYLVQIFSFTVHEY